MLLFGVFAYLVSLVSLLYAVGFVGNVIVPRSIDVPAGSASAASWAVDLALLGAFAIQHSGMARPGFKRWWTRSVPEPIERSTYVLVSSVLLLLVFWLWRPLHGEVWRVQDPLGRVALDVLCGLGWLTVVASSLMIDHFDLFGLRQTWFCFMVRDYEPPPFRTPLVYRYVRHPIMLGFVIAFWSSPTMTAGHLLFAATTTAYVLIAIALEERDLVAFYGDVYRAYQRRTGRLLPRPIRPSDN